MSLEGGGRIMYVDVKSLHDQKGMNTECGSAAEDAEGDEGGVLIWKRER